MEIREAFVENERLGRKKIMIVGVDRKKMREKSTISSEAISNKTR